MKTESQTVTSINPFEVPPEADEQFIRGWERARGLLASRDAFRAAALHRSIAPDAEFRYVSFAWLESAKIWHEAMEGAAFEGQGMPFVAHPGLYKPLRDEWTADVPECVVLINAFEVPVGEDDRFVAGWDGVRDALAVQPGYLGARLHVSLMPEADFRFINIARWESPEAFGRALAQPAFERTRAELPFTAHPSLYAVIRQ